MGEQLYVPAGAFLTCNKGSAVTRLVVTNNNRCTIYGDDLANELDKAPLLNIPAFGSCKNKSGNACIPVPTAWQDFQQDVFFGGGYLINDASTLPCSIGGTIEIHFSLADAQAALPPEDKGWKDHVGGFFSGVLSQGERNREWAKNLLGVEEGSWGDAIFDGMGTLDSFSAGLTEGLIYGGGDLVVGVKDLTVWSYRTGTMNMVLNPEDHALAIQETQETLTSMGNGVAELSSMWWESSIYNAYLDPEGFAEQWAKNEQMGQAAMDHMSNMDSRDWGNVGGYLGFEALMTVGTGGAGQARNLRHLENLDDVGDALRVLENTDDLLDASRGADEVAELGAVTNQVEDVVDPPGTFRDSNGRLRDQETGRYVEDPNKPPTTTYNRNMGERRNALLRDARDPNSDLTPEARQFILDNDGRLVPEGYEVSHEIPLYTAGDNAGKSALDVSDNMLTQPKDIHRARHMVCGDQYHTFGPPSDY